MEAKFDMRILKTDFLQPLQVFFLDYPVINFINFPMNSDQSTFLNVLAMSLIKLANCQRDFLCLPSTFTLKFIDYTNSSYPPN